MKKKKKREKGEKKRKEKKRKNPLLVAHKLHEGDVRSGFEIHHI